MGRSAEVVTRRSPLAARRVSDAPRSRWREQGRAAAQAAARRFRERIGTHLMQKHLQPSHFCKSALLHSWRVENVLALSTFLASLNPGPPTSPHPVITQLHVLSRPPTIRHCFLCIRSLRRKPVGSSLLLFFPCHDHLSAVDARPGPLGLPNLRYYFISASLSLVQRRSLTTL